MSNFILRYDLERYEEKLRLVIQRLDLTQLTATILISHKAFCDILSSPVNQLRYDSYWKTRGSWDALGVIESFMNPSFDLYKGMVAIF